MNVNSVSEVELNNKVCILIVGMHRSGTSAVARMVNLHGFDIANTLLSPSEDNQKGYWEAIDVYKFHEDLLGKYDLSWYSTHPLNQEYTKHDLDAKKWIKNYIISEFTNSDEFVIKDPRIARFLPLWKQALKSKLTHIEHDTNEGLQTKFQELRLEKEQLQLQKQKLEQELSKLTKKNKE